VYSEYGMFVAETASNFHQALLRAHFLKTETDPDFLLEVLNETMNNFHRYFFIMPILSQFEVAVHAAVERGEGLTAEGMSATLVGLFREGYGPEVVVDEARVGITWAQFGHLFANFYVHQYALGIAAANALADGVMREGRPAAERYIAFLKAGDSVYPLDALRIAGVDLTSPEPIERAFGALEDAVNRLDTLVGAGPLRG
jgi:oligoendopeptidase F